MVKLHFISLNKKWVQEMKKYFGLVPFCLVSHADIREISKEGAVFVSPANSLGYMDGGIDKVLSEVILPGCEHKVKNKIRTLNIQTALGRYYLPVGSAVLIPFENSALISAPTMFLPHDVSKTQNAYHAFMACLMCVKKYVALTGEKKIKSLIVTSLCCGYGKMSEEESAKQIYNAYIDFNNDRTPKEINFVSDPCVMLLPSMDEEQPNIFDNREIKNIDLKKLVKSRGF
jgi:O-acetyl-ADP-ribose deacetylase (regulator of RNase III)